MLYAGVSWSATGYGVEVLDAQGRSSAARGFALRETSEMIAFLRRLDRPVATVVDSTNGLLDGRMMAAGLDVYRADPPYLPERPPFGSVSARQLADVARRRLADLTRLERDRGTQTGRESDLAAGIEASATVVAELTAAGRYIHCGVRDRMEVALTFDDGPNPPYTGQILDTLERYGVPATFFCVGLNAGAHTDEIARISEQGHGVGNHTWSHPFLPELSRDQLAEQISRTADVIAGAHGGPAPALFRPPYGSRTPQVARWLGELAPTVVLWDVEPFDWALPGAETITRIVLDKARPGSIVLLHDGGGDRSQTVAAIPAIIEGLLAKGFRFVLVDDLVSATRSPSAATA